MPTVFKIKNKIERQSFNIILLSESSVCSKSCDTYYNIMTYPVKQFTGPRGLKQRPRLSGKFSDSPFIAQLGYLAQRRILYLSFILSGLKTVTLGYNSYLNRVAFPDMLFVCLQCYHRYIFVCRVKYCRHEALTKEGNSRLA